MTKERVLNMDVMVIAYSSEDLDHLENKYEWLIKYIYDNRFLDYTQDIIERYNLEAEVNHVRLNKRTYNKVV